MSSASSDVFLSLIVALCGIVCVTGYLLTFALSRRLVEKAARRTIGLGELIKPLVAGMVLGMLILAFQLTDAARDPLLVIPHASSFVSALLTVCLCGMCAGGWSGRPGAVSTPVAQADLIARLRLAGDTHEDAVARIAVRLALAAGYDASCAGNLMVAASLHNTGMAGVPDAIVNKAEPLDADEQRVMQSHTRIGHRMMARSHDPMLDLAAEIALHHHEHWDGTGYPSGLAGEAIPLTSRVVALAERFDELLNPRPGCEPPSFDAVTGSLQACAGTRFDPRLVTLLLGDLPGMVAARNVAPLYLPRLPPATPFTGWIRPGPFRALQPAETAF